MRKLVPVIIALASAIPAFVLADDAEPTLPVDSRIKILTYDESDVYTIPTKFGYQTNIVFAPGEEIQTVSMGDRSLWQIIPAGNRLFIRPMDEDVITNMTILTNRRSYQFDLKSVEADSKNTDIIYVAKFIYPEKRRDVPLSPYDEQMSKIPVAPPAEQPKPAPSMSPIPAMPPSPAAAPETTFYTPPAPVTATQAGGQPGQINHNYTYAGPDELAPLQVYDDGKSTYFKYRDMDQPLPNAYIAESGGKETPVAHYIKNAHMVVDDIAGEWVLKNSNGTIIVYNELLNPR